MLGSSARFMRGICLTVDGSTSQSWGTVTRGLSSVCSGSSSGSISSNVVKLPAELSDVASNIDAASSWEHLALVLGPTQLGAQMWEAVHTGTGLPWWASIPLTAIGLRAVLLPLTLRAKAASANMLLWEEAGQLAKEVLEKADSRAQTLGRQSLLSRKILHLLQKKHGLPPMRWYYTNLAVQTSVLVTLSMSLKQMSTAVWPGMTTEGPMYFVDLTSPPIFMSTFSTPYGSMGTLMPLALVLLSMQLVDQSAAARVSGWGTALKVGIVPLYLAALMQPHATLIYWLTHSASLLGIQAVMKPPALLASAGTGAPEGPKLTPELLLALGGEYGIKNQAAAATCFQVAEGMLRDADPAQLGALSQMLEGYGQWEVASKLSSRCAELSSEPAVKAEAYTRTANLLLQAGALARKNSNLQLANKDDPVLNELLKIATENARHALALQAPSAASLSLLARCQAASGSLDEACSTASQAAALVHKAAELSGPPVSPADAEATWKLHLELVDQLRAVGQDRNALQLASAVVMHTQPSDSLHRTAAKLVEKIPLN